MVALAEASYSYTTTLSKGKARSLKQIGLSAPSVSTAHRQALDKAHAAFQKLQPMVLCG